MKAAILSAILAASLLSAAQTTSAPAGQMPNAPAPQKGAPAQAAPPAAPAPLPGTRKPPEAKSQDELKAFQEAYAQKGGAQLEAAADAYAQKFPDSELGALIYRQAMYTYQQENNADKMIDMGRKMIAKDPKNPEALLAVGSTLAEKTRETDLDRDERLAEASKDLETAAQTVDTDLMLPVGMPAEQAEAIRKQMKGQIYGGLGMVAIDKKDYAGAEQNLRKASELSSGDARVWMRLAYALDKAGKYQEAITPANNCIQYSATDDPQVNTLCKTELERVKKLAAAGPAAKPAPTSPQPTTATPK